MVRMTVEERARAVGMIQAGTHLRQVSVMSSSGQRKGGTISPGGPSGRRKGPSPTPGQQNQGGKEKGKIPTTAAKIEGTAGNSQKNDAKTDDLSVKEKQLLLSLPSNVQKLLTECDPGKTIQQNAATFIIRSMKAHKSVEFEGDVIEKIVKIASPEILEEHRKDFKVLKSKDGRTVNIADLLDRKKTVIEVKGDKPSNSLDKPKEETEMEKKRNKSPNMPDISKTEGNEQKHENEKRNVASGIPQLEETRKEMYEKLNQHARKQVEMLSEFEASVNENYETERALRGQLQQLEKVKKELEMKMKENEDLKRQKEKLNKNIELVFYEKMEVEKEYEDAKKYIKRKIAEHEDTMKDEKRKNEDELKKISTERDDLRDRYDKLNQQAKKQVEIIRSFEVSVNENYETEMALKEQLQQLEKVKKDFGVQMIENEDLKRQKENLNKNIELVFYEKMEVEKEYEDAKKYIKRKIAEHEDTMKDEKRKNEDELKKISTERDDLLDRYEKLNQHAKKQVEMISEFEASVNENYESERALREQLQQLDKVKKEFGVQMIDDLKRQKENLNKNIELVFYEKIEVEKQYEDDKKCIKRKIAKQEDTMKHEKRKNEDELKKISTERDDLLDRFSKLAGSKLTDQNPDIADLSDPNRAMKLSERFGGLYDDEWTNAFEALTDMRIELKSAIQILLRMLSEAWTFCERMSESQMQSLSNVFLHPQQNVPKSTIDPRQGAAGSKDRPRINTKNEKVLRNLRREIGVMPQTVHEIKQAFYMETKSWNKEKYYDTKIIEACSPYLQSCAEICWLMILPDPPLFMQLDVMNGAKLDLLLYSVYSTSGDKINYLVWPALFNCKGGGLLSKGVAEPFRTVKKGK